MTWKYNKTTKTSTIKKIRNIFPNLDQQRQKESTVFQNKMIDVVHYYISSKPDIIKINI